MQINSFGDVIRHIILHTRFDNEQDMIKAKEFTDAYFAESEKPKEKPAKIKDGE